MEEHPQTATENWPPENRAFVNNAYHENQLANNSERPMDSQYPNGLTSDLLSEKDCKDTLSLFPKTFVINGLKNDCKSMHASVVHSEEHEDQSSLSASCEEEGSSLSFSNDCFFECGTTVGPSEKGVNLKGRSRRKPQHSLSKTELYNNSLEEEAVNSKLTVSEQAVAAHSNNSMHENLDFQIRKCMPRIKPEYFQVSQSADVLCEALHGDGGDLTQKNEYQCKECHVLFHDSNSLFQHTFSHHRGRNTGDESSKADFGGTRSHYFTSNLPKDTNHMNQNALNSMDVGYLNERNPQVDAFPNLKVDNAGDVEKTGQMSEMGQLIQGCHEHDERSDLIGQFKVKRGRRRKNVPADDPSGPAVICSVCSKAFKTRNNLKTHLCKFHSDRKDVIQEFLGQGEKMKEKAVCVLCGKFFISKSALLRHVDTRHAGEAYAKCVFCSEIFENENQLSEHVVIHTAERNQRNPLHCSSSGQDQSDRAKENFNTSDHYQRHAASDEHFQRESTSHQMDPSCTIPPHEIRNDIIPQNVNTQESPKREQIHSNQTNPDQSDQCIPGTLPQTNPDQSNRCIPDTLPLNSEDRVQTSHYFEKNSDLLLENEVKSKDIQCSGCKMSFDSLEAFALHCMASSECLNSRECPVCQKLINSSLKEHLKSHSDDRPYRCEICQASFKRNHQMKLHKQTVHSDVRLYHCELCDKSFKRRDKLTCHYRTHSDEHPFMCTECGSVFKWKHHLKRHKDNVHADKATQMKARKYPCTVCGNCFKWRHHLKRHLRNVHHLTEDSLDFDEIKISMDSEFMGNESPSDVIRAGNDCSMQMEFENNNVM